MFRAIFLKGGIIVKVVPNVTLTILLIFDTIILENTSRGPRVIVEIAAGSESKLKSVL